jgi:hypothetical protein
MARMAVWPLGVDLVHLVLFYSESKKSLTAKLAASKFMIDTGAGVVDADYRGVIYVLLFNLSDNDFEGK